MSEQSFCVKFSLVSGDFERACEASSKIKKMLQQIGVASDIIRRIAITGLMKVKEYNPF